MSFFKDLKEDIAQSVSELTEALDENLAAMDDKEISSDKLDSLTTDFPNEVPGEATDVERVEEEPILYQDDLLMEESLEPHTEVAGEIDFTNLDVALEEDAAVEDAAVEDAAVEDAAVEDVAEEDAAVEEVTEEVAEVETESVELAEEENEIELPEVEEEMEADIVSEEMKEEIVEEMEEVEVVPEMSVEEVEDEKQEVTVITKGTIITGGIKSDTSLVVKGTIEGDVECQGKLTITGKVEGNTIASEIYVNTPRLEGDINSRGIVKIDVGTVVIGNINCTSVLVSGAVKGNIEVNGPVIVDSTAVVKGDIKAKSIQINSGAVIDGHCSLAYADVDLDSFFE